MQKIFDIDSPFMRFMAKVADIIILNFLVLICSLGVVTIGPALVAVYYVTLKAVRNEEGGLIKSFFRSFKQNFIQGVVAFILSALIIAFFSYDVYSMYNWMNAENSLISKILFGAVTGVAIIFGIGILYIFPVIAKFYNSIFRAFRNSIAMGVANLAQTVLVVLITTAGAALVYINPYSLMFVIGAVAYFNSMCFVRVFDRYIKKEEPAKDDDTIFTDDTEAQNNDAPANDDSKEE